MRVRSWEGTGTAPGPAPRSECWQTQRRDSGEHGGEGRHGTVDHDPPQNTHRQSSVPRALSQLSSPPPDPHRPTEIPYSISTHIRDNLATYIYTYIYLLLVNGIIISTQCQGKHRLQYH